MIRRKGRDSPARLWHCMPMTAPAADPRRLPAGRLTAQWTVLVTVCVLLLQAFLGGPVLPKDIGLDRAALILCTEAGMVAGGETGGQGATRHDCGVACQTACAAAPLLLRATVLLPLPLAPLLARQAEGGVSTPALSGPPLRLSARGPPLFP